MTQSLYPEFPVLIIDDDDVLLRSFKIIFNSGGINNIRLCNDSREVLQLLAQQEFEAIILDLLMPNISGEELLEKIVAEFPATPVIIITGVDDTDTVVRCMKGGAYDFIVKPVDRNRLLAIVSRTLQVKKLERENQSLKSRFLASELLNPDAFNAFNTRNPQMQSIFRYMEVIAASSEPVLITGETGAGKEVVARTIHNLHNLHKGTGKFVCVNVAGLDDQLFSDTLFGHIRGAFTDARQDRKGLVEQAAGGILFLDEIGDLNMQSQVKLLRLLQEHEYYPIGADVPRTTDARIIVATNKNLEELRQSGQFRKDLYFRLCVHHLHVPSLRERSEDIPLLLDCFIREAAEDMGKKPPAVPNELYTLLSTYSFPGNIRELRAMVYNAVSLHSSRKMSMDAFKAAINGNGNRRDDAFPVDWNDAGTDFLARCFPDKLPSLKEIQLMLVIEAMNRADKNQSIAASMLGISRQALNKRLKDISLE